MLGCEEKAKEAVDALRGAIRSEEDVAKVLEHFEGKDVPQVLTPLHTKLTQRARASGTEGHVEVELLKKTLVNALASSSLNQLQLAEKLMKKRSRSSAIGVQEVCQMYSQHPVFTQSSQ